MKKILLISCALSCAFMSISCSSLQNLTDSISAFFSNITNSISSNTENNPPSKTQKASEEKSLSIPKSYEKAYLYRTDIADKKATSLLKNSQINSLRINNTLSYLPAIAKEINNVAQNDFEKAKIAHDVITLLISYDAASFWAGKVPSQDFISVLKTRKAVCEGYANVFKELCNNLGLPCKKVHGYARGVGTSILEEDSNFTSNHAWNIVQLENNWYLVDCTWDSGYMNGKIAKQQYTTDWLFLKPDHFIYTHFPQNQQYQLLSNPIAKQDFALLSDLRPKFFEITNKINPFPTEKIQVANELTLRINEKSGFQLDFTVSNSSTKRKISNCFIIQRNENEDSKITFSFPVAGNYIIDIFYRKTGASQGTSCGQFLVSTTSSNPIRYPTLFYVSGKTELISPLTMPLCQGKTYTFSVKTTDKKVAAVICGKKYNYLVNDGTGLFSGQITIPYNTKTISLGLANTENGSFEILAKYEVQ